ALDHQQSPVRGRTGGLRGAALDPDGAAHHVLGDTGAGIAVDGDLSLLVHPRAVVAKVSVDRDLYRYVDTDRDIVGPGGVIDEEFTGQIRCVQGGVYLPQWRFCQVVCQRLHAYTTSGSGSQIFAFSTPGSDARARYSLAIATQSGVSAITAGLHAMASRTTANESWLDTSRV